MMFVTNVLSHEMWQEWDEVSLKEYLEDVMYVRKRLERRETRLRVLENSPTGHV
jgi:hypothetical protein